MLRLVLLAVFLQMSECILTSDGLTQPPAPGQLQGNSTTSKEEISAFQAIEQANNAVGNLRMNDRSGLFLHEGDIELTGWQRKVIKKQNSGGRQRRGAMRSLSRRWMDPNGRPLIPYYIEGSVAHARGVIDQAMRHWMSKVPCLRFVRRTTHRNYISFFSGGGCYSMVGRVGGGQKISIGRGCNHIGVVVHEIGHALGFWHEQSRPDRDRYINIHWNNIPSGVRSQFSKMSTSSINSRGISYDYDSVMHYHSTAFGNGRITITRKDGSTKLGNTRGLSAKDVQQANLMYCNGQPTNRPVTARPPTVSDRSGLFLYEGDIELTERQRKMIKTQISGGRRKRATLRSLSRRWMDSSGRPLIPYYIEGSVGQVTITSAVALYDVIAFYNSRDGLRKGEAAHSLSLRLTFVFFHLTAAIPWWEELEEDKRFLLDGAAMLSGSGTSNPVPIGIFTLTFSGITSQPIPTAATLSDTAQLGDKEVTVGETPVTTPTWQKIVKNPVALANQPSVRRKNCIMNRKKLNRSGAKFNVAIRFSVH
ncbi:Protein SpAN [Stylophora pistillata]|uniref:Metalloendopeptidase n=1 Tax=Stylophora pistillata TaxID=50429 RepID=A0A2B4S0R4_STYPI|nr:Protein SpAN [Stylophora pistillata]